MSSSVLYNVRILANMDHKQLSHRDGFKVSQVCSGD